MTATGKRRPQQPPIHKEQKEEEEEEEGGGEPDCSVCSLPLSSSSLSLPISIVLPLRAGRYRLAFSSYFPLP